MTDWKEHAIVALVAVAVSLWLAIAAAPAPRIAANPTPATIDSLEPQ